MEGGQPPPSKRLCCVRVCGLASSNCPLLNNNHSSSSSSSLSSSLPSSSSSSNTGGPSSSSRQRHHRDSRLSFDSSSSSSSNHHSSSHHRRMMSSKSGDLQPESLLDLSAKVVALHIPFARIEERVDRIPEPVQNRIIFWSFPRNERDICMYSTLSSSTTSSSSSAEQSSIATTSTSSTLPVTSCSGCGQEMQRLPFYKGLRLYESGAVDSVLQVGFHLSGTVSVKGSSSSSPATNSSSTSNASSLNHSQLRGLDLLSDTPSSSNNNNNHDKKVRVSITFDRCKITSVTCTCDAKDIFWCQHVVALSIYRIRNPTLVKLRVPISETLYQLDREQLQKLLQYMIAEHHTEVLPTAQKLADEILQSKSVINSIAGAPDPTSGPCAEAEHSWHLDEDQVSQQVKNFLSQGSQGITNAIRQINALFGKVKEMLGARDSNAGRMLRLITEQFLQDPRLPERGSLWRSSNNSSNLGVISDKCRILWDQLACLWVCIVLNPHANHAQRYAWRSLLEKWSRLPICPLEDYDFNSRSHHHHSLHHHHHHHVPGSQHSHHAALKRHRLNALLDDLSSSSEDEDDSPPVNAMLPSHPLARFMNSRTDSNNNNVNGGQGSRKSKSPPLPRTIFQRALEASHLTWDDAHLRFILDNDNYSIKSQPSYSMMSCPSGPSSRGSSHYYHGGNYGGFPSTSSNCAASSSSSSSSSYSTAPSSSSSNSAQFTSQGYPLWNESIAVSAARVEALRCHGYRREALRLAVTVVRTMKRQQKQLHQRWNLEQRNKASSSTDSSGISGVSHRPLHYNMEGWVGNLLDPIGSLFDTLAEASLDSPKATLDNYYGSLFMIDLPTTSSSSSSAAVNVHSVFNNMVLNDDIVAGSSPTISPSTPRDRPLYKHTSVPGNQPRSSSSCRSGHSSSRSNCDREYDHQPETYLTLALDCALMGLGQQRLLPPSPYSQDKAMKQEERLIVKLMDIELDSILVSTLRNQAEVMLESGPFSGFGIGIHAESYPMHTFAKYLFTSLLPHDEPLAYDIGLRAMRLPMMEGLVDPEDTGLSQYHGAFGRLPRLQATTLDTIQKQQCCLALTMLSAAKDDRNRLQEVSRYIQKHIHASRYLYKVAEEAMKTALNSGGVRSEHLLETAFNIGLQVMQMTKGENIPWKRKASIDWMVNCATEVGLYGLQKMMQDWKKYFTAVEAIGSVAMPVMNSTTMIRLNLSSLQHEELASYARVLALECLTADPLNCAIMALTLCESDHPSFVQAYEIIKCAGSASTPVINPPTLFQIAKFMEGKALMEPAFKVALLAVKGVMISPNGDNHEHIHSIHWTCQLAFTVKDGLMTLVPILVRNIQCAPVLADILKRCINPTPLPTPTGISGMPPPIPPILTGHHHSSSHHYHHHHSHHHYHESTPSSTSHKRSSSSRSHCHSSKNPPIIDRVEKPPLRLLLDAAIAAYVNTTHSRLTHISPRHYGDFIEFLTKAQDTFTMSRDGPMQFASLLENMKMVYKGKKKLMFLVKERFG